MTDEERVTLFEKTNIKKAVLKQSVPAVISQMITLIYNLADTYFVGLLNSPVQTSAVTVAYAPFLMLSAVSNLFGVGGSSTMARALGKHDRKAAGEIASVSFWFGILTAVCYSLVFFLFMKPLLYVCGATDATWTACRGYSFWTVVIGGSFTVMNTSLANLIRGEGNARTASLGASFGGILNIILDPIFVLPQFLDMGAAGAGLATAISNFAASAFFAVFILRNRKTEVVNFSLKSLLAAKEHLGNILSIGLPSFLQMALTVVAVSAQTHFVSAYATEAMAGLGITKKLDQLPLYVSIGISNGLMPIIAYNHSRGNNERRSGAFKVGVTATVSFSLFCLVIYELFAPQLTSIFIDDPVTINYAAGFLRRMVIAMPFMSVCYPMIIQFQAMKRVKEALICSILRKGALDIPLLMIMDRLIPLYGCMWVQPIVDFTCTIVCVVFYLRITKSAEA